MKTKLLLFATVLLIFISTRASFAQKNESKKTETATFIVSMTCEGCQKRLEKNISWEKGVKDMKIDLKEKTVSIKYDPTKTDSSKLKTAIEKLQFTCELQE